MNELAKMKKLQVFYKNGFFVVDSRDVAEMVEKNHYDLLESIDRYTQYLQNGNFRSADFFIPSTYKASGNCKTHPCYLLTRKGCDLVANKMTSKKGVLFTAAYVTKFEEMEKGLKVPVSPSVKCSCITPTEAIRLSEIISTASEDKLPYIINLIKGTGINL